MYKFECPNCEGIRLEEVQKDCLVSSQIMRISDSDLDVEYGEPIVHEGTVVRYQCDTCGYILKDSQEEPITTLDDLVKHFTISQTDEEDKERILPC